jgi:hypothetical protein
MVSDDMLFNTVLAYIRDMWKMRGSVGHLVITSPLELRAVWQNKDELRKAANTMVDFLKGEGFKKGFYNWHFAGEQSRRFYPHLHIVIPSGYIGSKRLGRIRNFVRDLWGIKVFYYGYIREYDKLEHLVRSILKPTLDKQDEVSVDEWRDFQSWGFW